MSEHHQVLYIAPLIVVLLLWAWQVRRLHKARIYRMHWDLYAAANTKHPDEDWRTPDDY